jgi:hypothetical protein
MMSSSVMNEVQKHTVVQSWDNACDEDEGKFEHNDEDENEETTTDKDKQEMDQEARKLDDLCSLTTSEVDSWGYSEEEEQDGEDDKAFFKQMDVLSVEDQNSMSATNDADEGEEPAYQTQRSGCTIRAPKILIEEMNALSVEKEIEAPKWNDCMVELFDSIYEKALVGTGIGGGFVHSSELNVKNYDKAMQSKDMDDLLKWIKGWMRNMPGFCSTKCGQQC